MDHFPIRTGDRASLALGCMNFGKRTSEDDARKIVHRALDAGITVFDTANAYNGGESERILGRVLKGRNDVAIATKVGFGQNAGKPEGLSRERVLAAIDESLERLGRESVDLYYLHVPDHRTPIEETLEAMHEVLKSGKVRAWAVSNYASWQILEMIFIADRKGMPRPIASQQMYNALVRQLEIEYFKFTKKHPIHTTVYNPLAGGLLSGSAGKRFENNALYQRRYLTPAMQHAVDALQPIAKDAGMTLVTLAYRWLVDRPGVDSILVGPASLAHLDDAIAACSSSLQADVRAKVDGVYRELAGTDATYAR